MYTPIRMYMHVYFTSIYLWVYYEKNVYACRLYINKPIYSEKNVYACLSCLPYIHTRSEKNVCRCIIYIHTHSEKNVCACMSPFQYSFKYNVSVMITK